MKTYELTKTQAHLKDLLEAADFAGAWWGNGARAERFYFHTARRDVKVFLTFDDPATCEGVALKIFIEDCGQHPNWYAAQRQKLASAFAGAVDIAREIARPWDDPRDVAARHGAPIAEAEAEALPLGAEVHFFTGGAPGEDNPEREVAGTVTAVRRETARPGTVGDAETVYVELDGLATFYTWRGLLRYGSGAQVVRRQRGEPAAR